MKKTLLNTLYLIFILLCFLYLFSCNTVGTAVKREKSFEEKIKETPILALFYVSEIEYRGFLVIEKSSIPEIKPGSYDFYLKYLKNNFIKLSLYIKFLSKEVEILHFEYNFLKNEGFYIFMQEGLKKIDQNFFYELNLSPEIFIYFINNILLLFSDDQKDIIKVKEGNFVYNEFEFELKEKKIQKSRIEIFMYYFYFNYCDWRNYDILYYPQLIKYDLSGKIFGSIIISEVNYKITKD
ncbi:MAG: hypothetical protein N3A58_02785 [Spirochaetes bacterium]|nr:hypothetical protein [Spirochaetota bacterium]